MTLKKRVSTIECYETLKAEAWEDIAATVVKDIVSLFEKVNEIESPEERLREFIKRGDELMIHHWKIRFGD